MCCERIELSNGVGDIYSNNLYIFPRNPLVSLSVCLLVYACSAKTIEPRSFIFSMEVGLDGGPLIFYNSRSKVKGQGQIGMKMWLFGANLGHRS